LFVIETCQVRQHVDHPVHNHGLYLLGTRRQQRALRQDKDRSRTLPRGGGLPGPPRRFRFLLGERRGRRRQVLLAVEEGPVLVDAAEPGVGGARECETPSSGATMPWPSLPRPVPGLNPMLAIILDAAAPYLDSMLPSSPVES
jgi:hypothetical protein